MTASDSIIVEINSDSTAFDIDAARLKTAVRLILDGHSFTSAEISLAVVTDARIHQLNRQWLDHDEATDVLSFVIERSDKHLEGDVIASADTALHRAREGGWEATDELLLYVIHGVLHLVGYDDIEPTARAVMRAEEAKYMAKLATSQKFRGVSLETAPDDFTEVRPSVLGAQSS